MNPQKMITHLKVLSPLLGLLLLSVIGCKKKETPAAAPASSPPPAPVAVELAPAAAPAQTQAPQEARKIPREPANPKEVRTAFDQYSKNIGGPPGSWEELIEAKLMRSIPMAKDGKPLDFTSYQEYLGRGGK